MSIRQTVLALKKAGGKGREGRIVPRTKTGKARVVELDKATVAMLRAWKAEQARERLMMGAGYRDSDLVGRRPDGGPYHPEIFSREFLRKLCQALQGAAGDPAARPAPHLGDAGFGGGCRPVDRRPPPRARLARHHLEHLPACGLGDAGGRRREGGLASDQAASCLTGLRSSSHGLTVARPIHSFRSQGSRPAHRRDRCLAHRRHA